MACWYSYVFKFQSTLPRGERPIHNCTIAPTILFQSTLPRGERLLRKGHCVIHVLFQSTLPRGERLPTELVICAILDYFNPRSREGSDTVEVYQEMKDIISIHAPARGATIGFACLQHCLPYFNPRSREGSDYKVLLVDLDSQGFQSTLPRGERLQKHTNN